MKRFELFSTWSKLAAIALFVAFTNPGLITYAGQYIEQRRWGTLAAFLFLWAIAIVAVLVATFQRDRPSRIFWAVLIGLSSAIGHGFYRLTGNELSMFDVASLWIARHEAGRAFEFYAPTVVSSLVVFAIGFAIIAAPSIFNSDGLPSWRRWIWRGLPAAPVVLFVAVVLIKEGGGSYGLPTQFAPLSVAALSGVKIASHEVPPRQDVSWTASRKKISNVVLIVDESVRADYINWQDGNPQTPEFARLKPRLIDFGHAVSAANCSSYSNAILRFGATRHDLMHTVMSNATIWQYAKAAGFRTVYIDAQAAFVKGPDKLQNFMTAAERTQIDAFHAIDGTVPTWARDDKLADILKEVLKSDEPTFVYAVKNGAHFPYDTAYPPDRREFQPTMSETGLKDRAGLINSYRNAIRWAVDRVFGRIVEGAPLDRTLIIYTSDHGQNLSTSALSHCTTENPDPREALVPLVAITQDSNLKQRLAAPARSYRGHFSHFSIVPTLLDVFGYDRRDIAGKYGPSLFDPPPTEAVFTSGDIFGLVASKVRLNKIDLSRDYMEKIDLQN